MKSLRGINRRKAESYARVLRDEFRRRGAFVGGHRAAARPATLRSERPRSEGKENPRFVVTNLSRQVGSKHAL